MRDFHSTAVNCTLGFLSRSKSSSVVPTEVDKQLCTKAIAVDNAQNMGLL